MEKHKIIGLMSGTSGDGLDIAYCEFEKPDQWHYHIGPAETVEFPDDLGHQLANAHLLESTKLIALDHAFGKWMGQQVREFCDKHQLKPDAVSSHGHTVFHQPSQGFTLQIGSGWDLAIASQLPTIADLRSKDLALGGQGAPLAPVGDHFLFSAYDFCLNLGGISNISMIEKKQRVAYDVCPFNLLLNQEAQKLGHAYDAGGHLAKQGEIQPELLAQLNGLSFYKKNHAKSLGREDMEEVFMPLLQQANAQEADILRTLVEHYAIQIAQVITQSSPRTRAKVLLTGGGTYNQFFVERLSQHLGDAAEVVIPSQKTINFKEALIFAFLGLLHLQGLPNSFASVTGASANSVGGIRYQP
ncbi:anhydro-N-acetylmuramic acid kinase [Echinicola pacifica]|uniref:Anhydro-N-acetylmuramic acid kinase n=1 Tax=Echinicola pacifica TaxID=346377 RepID=A0A918ULN9_9BACT|nr:anhydro-N-acetylmuramic acid kinase [Echinicola pacifica]GGZ18909.1 anhydro-N-acetylmuramic acid kinase [Echinicola pacifica]